MEQRLSVPGKTFEELHFFLADFGKARYIDQVFCPVPANPVEGSGIKKSGAGRRPIALPGAAGRSS